MTYFYRAWGGYGPLGTPLDPLLCSYGADVIIAVVFVCAVLHMNGFHTFSVQLQCVIYTKDMNRSHTV